MVYEVNLRGLFSRDAIARQLKALPPLETPVLDTFFPARPQHSFPLLGIEEIIRIAKARPMVRRGSAAVNIGGNDLAFNFIEPMPIRLSVGVTGQALNNLKLLKPEDRDGWASRQTEGFRLDVRATSEAVASQSIAGKISWPVQLENGGWDTYEVDFGTPSQFEPTTFFDAQGAGIRDVHKCCLGMKKVLQKAGYGGSIEIWAGEDAFNQLLALAEGFQSTAQFIVQIAESAINVAGFVIKLRAEEYQNPRTGAYAPVVAADKMVMGTKLSDRPLFFCALDDLDSNLVAMPLFVKPIKRDEPSGWLLVCESKPFPVPVIKSFCWATVLGGGA